MEHLPPSVQSQLLEGMLDGSRVSALVTDPGQEDNPIIYVNRTFETMTGYKREEAIGHNCRFLQGEDTDEDTVNQIKQAIAAKKPITTVLKNYKKDGTLFWNRLSVGPITVEGKDYFIGTQTDVSVQYRQLEELAHKESEIEKLMLPIMRIQDDLAAVSLIGEMTEERCQLLKQKLAEFVQKQEVDHVILDVTGIHWKSDKPLDHFLEIRQILQLMGVCTYLTGISPTVAQAISNGMRPDEELKTYSNIQQAIQSIG